MNKMPLVRWTPRSALDFQRSNLNFRQRQGWRYDIKVCLEDQFSSE